MWKEPWLGFVFPDVETDLLEEPHDLGHGLLLRKATPEETQDKYINSAFQAWASRRSNDRPDQRLEFNEKPRGAWAIRPIEDPSKWRHAVVECQNGEISFQDVNFAFALSAADLRLGYIKPKNPQYGGLHLWRNFPILNFRDSLLTENIQRSLPSKKDLPEVRKNLSCVLNNVSNLSKNFEDFFRIIQIFFSLDHLPDTAPLKILGYFSVIEGLLSHPPKTSDPNDSIQRQLIRNINLLNNRLNPINRGIDFSSFRNRKIDKVLGQFYAYRSTIAHGGSEEKAARDLMNLTDLNSLDSYEQKIWVHDWMRNLTKKLLLAAVIEPDLVRDLK